MLRNVKDMPKVELINDLKWARGYLRICKMAVEDYDPDVMTQPVGWFQERVNGCYEIIARAVFEIARRNNVHSA